LRCIGNTSEKELKFSGNIEDNNAINKLWISAEKISMLSDRIISTLRMTTLRSNTKIQEIISRELGLHCLGVQKRTDTGVINDVWSVACKEGLFYLKKYSRSMKDVVLILAAEVFVKKHNIPALAAVESKLLKVSGEYYALYPKSPGLQVPAHNLSDAALFDMGVTLAKIHAVSTTRLAVPLRKINTRWDTEQFVKKAKDLREKIMQQVPKTAFDQMALKNLNLKLEEVQALSLNKKLDLGRTTIVHGDFTPDNIFLKAKKVVGIIDWEKSGSQPASLEVVRSLLYICFRDNLYNDAAFLRARSFLRGYQSIYQLDTEVFADALHAHHAKQLHSTWIETEHYLKGEHRADIFLAQKWQANKYFVKQLRDFTKKIVGIVSAHR